MSNGALPLDLANVLNRAIKSQQAGDFDTAERLYKRVLSKQPEQFEALHFLGLLESERGRLEEADRLVARSLKVNRSRPEAFSNHARILNRLGRAQDALACSDTALSMSPGLVEALVSRGMALQGLGRLDESVECHNRALSRQPNYVPAIVNRANALRALGRYEEARADYDLAYKLDPKNEAVNSGRLECTLWICDFDRMSSVEEGLKSEILSGATDVSPFLLTALWDDPALHFQASRNYSAQFFKSFTGARLWSGKQYAHERIKVAYLSADFQTHATAVLISELLELHDRARFEVHGVSYGSDDQSPMRQRIVQACDVFHDVAAKSDLDVAKRLRALEIDIAVDLKGWTKGARPGFLAHRPAPVQVGYLGYPGTVGADFLDYILADGTVAPFDHAAFYSEKIVQLPNCYQVNDRLRSVPENSQSRRDAGLPETGFVFCCFNNNYKIRPAVFAVWMRLLTQVPGSVLWLLQDNPIAERNLRQAAQNHGIDPARLVFAERTTPHEHLARHRMADLFLDTLPYNAHTTASDALWTGLPVVTCEGNAFAGRVASSLLKAAGLPQLITHSMDEYENLALRLANDAAALADVRAALARNLPTCPLFDTDRFRRGIEGAYLQMWQIAQAGDQPRAFRAEPVDGLSSPPTL